MKTDKTKLLQDIKAMKEKLASMEEELNKPEEIKHFPSKGDKYYFYTSSRGPMGDNIACDDNLKVNAYKTEKEAQKAYNKAVAVEKIKRRLLELQGDWKPNWSDVDEEVFYITYYHIRKTFIASCWSTTQWDTTIPCIKNKEISGTIIEEMEDELKLIFDIA